MARRPKKKKIVLAIVCVKSDPSLFPVKCHRIVNDLRLTLYSLCPNVHHGTVSSVIRVTQSDLSRSVLMFVLVSECAALLNYHYPTANFGRCHDPIVWILQVNFNGDL